MAVVKRMVSLPEELDDAIKRCGKRLNWSAVAAEAFKAKLAEIASNREPKRVEDVVRRLQATLSQNARLGEGAGRQWAESRATVWQLERVAEVVRKSGFFTFVDDAPPGFELVRMIEPHYSYDDATAFFAEITKEPRKDFFDRAFVSGFAQGAADVWFEVKTQVTGN